MKKTLVFLVFVMLATALLDEPPFAQTEDGKIRLMTREISLGVTREVSLENAYPDVNLGSLVVSPDSKRVAYSKRASSFVHGAKTGGKQFVVVDEVEGKKYDEIGEGSLLFSPDSKRVAYVAKRGDKWLVVVDEMEGKEYDGIGFDSLPFSPVFSPDSKRVAYVARRSDNQFVVVDEMEGKEYDEIGFESLLFSPDGKRVAYIAKRGDKQFVVVDGEEGKQYDSFLRGSKLVFDSPKLFHTLARQNSEIFRIEVEIVEE